MADVYGRITGQPQMCYSTFGPGLTNLSTGVCSAILDRSPMLVVSAQIHRSEICFNQTHQCIDNVEFMKPLTKYSAQIENLLDIPKIAKEAIEISVNGIPGPVYISFPFDLMQEEIKDEIAEKLLEELTSITKIKAISPDFKKLNLIIEKIKKAKHPIIVVGNQVIRENCCDELIAFANKHNIPVICSLAAKGVVPEEHPLFITAGNKYIDKIYQEALTKNVFEACDLILLIGYDFGEDLKPSLWESKIESIIINAFYEDMGNVFQPSLLYLGDIAQSLKYISQVSIPSKEIPDAIKKYKEIFDKREIQSEKDGLIGIASLMKVVRNSLGESGILCSDIGLHKQYAGLLSKAYMPNTFLCSNVCGTFGFGMPAGLGAKLAKPDVRVCVICGDGGFHSTSQDLETAVRYNIPIIIIVLKDNAFGLIKYYQLLERKEVFSPSVEFGEVDFVKLAEANGMQARKVNQREISELEKILNDAFEAKKPFLVEIPIDYKYNL